MVEIAPSFKNQEEKNIVAATIGISLVLGLTGILGVVAPLVVYFGMSEKLSESGKEIIRAFINFEIFMTILIIVLTISMIGALLVPVAGIIALIFVIIALLAVLNNTVVKIPVPFEFIKKSANVSYNQNAEQQNQENSYQPNNENSNQ